MHRQAFLNFYDHKKFDHSSEFRVYNQSHKRYVEGEDDYFNAMEEFCNSRPDTSQLTNDLRMITMNFNCLYLSKNPSINFAKIIEYCTGAYPPFYKRNCPTYELTGYINQTLIINFCVEYYSFKKESCENSNDVDISEEKDEVKSCGHSTRSFQDMSLGGTTFSSLSTPSKKLRLTGSSSISSLSSPTVLIIPKVIRIESSVQPPSTLTKSEKSRIKTKATLQSKALHDLLLQSSLLTKKIIGDSTQVWLHDTGKNIDVPASIRCEGQIGSSNSLSGIEWRLAIPKLAKYMYVNTELMYHIIDTNDSPSIPYFPYPISSKKK